MRGEDLEHPFLTARVDPGDVLIREIDGQSVLLNLDTGRYHGLDAQGLIVLHVGE